jgi:hypothetical protein
MGKIVEYVHHGVNVKVDEDQKGKHKLFCLCFTPCSNFYPGEDRNCQIAQLLFAIDKAFGLVTPVWECPLFHEKGVKV